MCLLLLISRIFKVYISHTIYTIRKIGPAKSSTPIILSFTLVQKSLDPKVNVMHMLVQTFLRYQCLLFIIDLVRKIIDPKSILPVLIQNIIDPNTKLNILIIAHN